MVESLHEVFDIGCQEVMWLRGGGLIKTDWFGEPLAASPLNEGEEVQS